MRWKVAAAAGWLVAALYVRATMRVLRQRNAALRLSDKAVGLLMKKDGTGFRERFTAGDLAPLAADIREAYGLGRK